MTNAEKFKTANERAKEFGKWCNNNRSQSRGPTCKVDMPNCFTCQFAWLDLEAEEEKIENCPYCGGECYAEDDDGKHRVFCRADLSCRYSSGTYTTEHEAVAAHNRMARAVMEAGNKERE